MDNLIVKLNLGCNERWPFWNSYESRRDGRFLGIHDCTKPIKTWTTIENKASWHHWLLLVHTQQEEHATAKRKKAKNRSSCQSLGRSCRALPVLSFAYTLYALTSLEKPFGWDIVDMVVSSGKKSFDFSPHLGRISSWKKCTQCSEK